MAKRDKRRQINEKVEETEILLNKKSDKKTKSEDSLQGNESDELSRLRVDMVGLSETKRPGSGKTSSKGFTYYSSGMSNGDHVKGVAIGISSRLQPSVAEVTPVD